MNFSHQILSDVCLPFSNFYILVFNNHYTRHAFICNKAFLCRVDCTEFCETLQAFRTHYVNVHITRKFRFRFFPWNFIPFQLRILAIYWVVMNCLTAILLLSTSQNVLKLCRYLGHNFLISILPGNIPRKFFWEFGTFELDLE